MCSLPFQELFAWLFSIWKQKYGLCFSCCYTCAVCFLNLLAHALCSAVPSNFFVPAGIVTVVLQLNYCYLFTFCSLGYLCDLVEFSSVLRFPLFLFQVQTSGTEKDGRMRAWTIPAASGLGSLDSFWPWSVDELLLLPVLSQSFSTSPLPEVSAWGDLWLSDTELHLEMVASRGRVSLCPTSSFPAVRDTLKVKKPAAS